MVGMVEEKCGRANYGKVRYYYQIARDLNPTHWIGPYNIACIESKSGNYKEALKILQGLLKDPIRCKNYPEIFNPEHYNKEHLLLPGFGISK